jgi:CheY-like chemotaxis protein
MCVTSFVTFMTTPVGAIAQCLRAQVRGAIDLPHLRSHLCSQPTASKDCFLMPRSAEIAAQLPFLRRYARALTGSQQQGDALVEQALVDVVARPEQLDADTSLRLALFAALQRAVASAAGDRAPPTNNRIAAIPVLQRQLLLLTALESFPISEAAAVTGLAPEAAEAELAAAYAWLDAQLHTSVLIIEDEPLIAMDLEHLVQDLGHRVTALAATRSDAVAALAQQRPGLVLADIQLADGSSGIDAVKDIQAQIDVPVIFITAFPERLLTGEAVEPAFLITKPFRPAAVRATIAQALMFSGRGG